MPPEFELIRHYFSRQTFNSVLAGGDDAALIAPSAGTAMAVSTDTLVAGTHFYPDTDPTDLGWKALAVNLSDLAAMGAAPRWAFLAITLPEERSDWLAAFAEGFYQCADSYGVDLAGGDTTRGPCAMTVTVVGEVPVGKAVLRSGANVDDEIWISGEPGLAALGLACLQGRVRLEGNVLARCLAALHRPIPRVELGIAIRHIASAMLDVSDGLAGDLRHILCQSRVGARLHLDKLPRAVHQCNVPPELARQCLLGGGDDYELLFTAPANLHNALTVIAHRAGVSLSCIGQVTAEPEQLLLVENDGTERPLSLDGFDHFR